jgi:molybdate transport system regulatory protein
LVDNHQRLVNKRETVMKLSARNQFTGTVDAVTEGAVNGVVTIKLGADTVTADITMAAIMDLGLEVGKEATAVIKASNVLIAKGDSRLAGLSARNQFPGTVEKVAKGAVNGHVSIRLADGNVLVASITNEAIEELDLREGAPALGIVKATDVMVAV